MAVPAPSNRFLTRMAHLFLACMLSLASCCSTKKCFLCDGHDEHSVASVEVFPSLVHAEPATTFLWDAFVKDAQGVPVVGDLEGHWAPTDLVQPTGDPTSATVTVPSTTTAVYPDFLVEIEGVTGEAEVRVGSSGAGSEVVKIPHAGGDAATAVLLDGTPPTDADPCLDDLSLAVVGTAYVKDLTWKSEPAPCPQEAVVFARGSGVIRIEGNAITGGPLLEVADADLPDRRPLDVYMVDRVNGDALDEMHLERESASTLYDLNRAGIWFNEIETRVLAQDYAQVKTTECDNAAYLAGVLGIPASELDPPGTPDPASMKLYVAYVPDLVDAASKHPKGKICHANDKRGPVVLISVAEKKATTFPHEMGHALLGETFGGHVFTDPSNVMSAWIDASCGGATRDHIWLGQAFRMNLDEESWLLHGLPSTELEARGARDCNAAFANCPVEDKDVGDGTP